MKAYILSVVGVSLIAAMLILLTPDGKGGSLGKHIKLLTSLALLCVIIKPFLSFAKSLSDTNIDKFKDSILEGTETGGLYEGIFYESLSDMSADKLEKELKDIISKKFGIDNEDININAEYRIEENSVSFVRINVILSGGAIFKSPYEIEAYVKELTGIECKCSL